jgi:hypothetical protein
MAGTLILKLLARLVDLAIRSVIFIVPVALVAYWCDVQPTWKLFAFVFFCKFWSDVVFNAKDDSTRQDEQAAAIKRKVAMLTSAQVAVEARKLTRAITRT